jgi:threonine synthase
MPADTPVEINVQTISYGANLILVENSTVSDCIDMITDLSESNNWTHLTTAAAVNPYHFEGTKTIAFEIAEDLGWNTPAWVIMPA